MKLTYPQRNWIVGRSDSRGRITGPGNNGFVKSSWRRTMERLRVCGLVQPNAHGEYELTPEGEAYKEGSLAAEIVWLTVHPRPMSSDNVLRAVSDVIGPNVLHPEETKQGATDRWADLRASRAFARCRVLPRHDRSRQ